MAGREGSLAADCFCEKLAVAFGRGPHRSDPSLGRAAGRAENVAGRSIITAASTYMEAWNAAHPDAPLAQQEVVITVPASFDEVARALTVKAARQAGFEKFTLVEEPQAAFYDFTARHRHDLSVRSKAFDWSWWWMSAAERPISLLLKSARRCAASRSAST